MAVYRTMKNNPIEFKIEMEDKTEQVKTSNPIFKLSSTEKEKIHEFYAFANHFQREFIIVEEEIEIGNGEYSFMFDILQVEFNEEANGAYAYLMDKLGLIPFEENTIEIEEDKGE